MTVNAPVDLMTAKILPDLTAEIPPDLMAKIPSNLTARLTYGCPPWAKNHEIHEKPSMIAICKIHHLFVYKDLAVNQVVQSTKFIKALQFLTTWINLQPIVDFQPENPP